MTSIGQESGFYENEGVKKRVYPKLGAFVLGVP